MKAEILILGVLHRGPFHPYEIKRRLTNAMVQCFTDVDVGTLYYAVRRLAADGLIEPLSREQVTRGGVRTVYRITPAGRARFQDLLYELFERPGTVADSLYVAMLFLHLCELPRTEALLAQRIEKQKSSIAELARIQRALGKRIGTGATHLLKHLEAQRRLDLRWLQALHADVAAGRVRDVPPPAS